MTQDALERFAAHLGPDPLRTFDINLAEWGKVKNAVAKEGFDEWDQYAPSIVAAIEAGYLDRHLQMLGKFLRARYYEVVNGGESPLYYTPRVEDDEDVQDNGYGDDDEGTFHVDTVPMTAPHQPQTLDELKNLLGTWTYPILPQSGVQPVRKMPTPETHAGNGEFRCKGYVFKKAEFVDKHFLFNSTKLQGIFRIEKIDKVKATCRLVVKTATSGNGGRYEVGAAWSFQLDRQRWYNLPTD